MTSSQQQVYELHFMGCTRCLGHVEHARAGRESKEGRDGHMGSRAWLAAQAANSDEIRWYQGRRLAIARAVIDGATLKAAGEQAGITAERVRQILVQLSSQVLASPGCAPAPADMHTAACATEGMRKHADWWRARLDELAASWGIEGETVDAKASLANKGVKDAVAPR